MEDKEANLDHNHPSLLLPNNNHNTTNTATPKEESHSLRKPTGGGGGSSGGGGGDRLKRDEWSEGAVSTLLEAYEAKWVLRNRAKLKGHDWEDIARSVSSRADSTKSPKTQTKCKNKIESMKKRYRSESATAEASSWPLYSRLDLLLRGTGPVSTPTPPPPPPPLPPPTTVAVPPLMVLEPLAAVSQPPHQPPPLSAPPPLANAQNSHGSNGADNRLTKEDGLGTKSSHEHVSNKNPTDTDSSTPALYGEKQDNSRCNNKRKMLKMEHNMNMRRRRTNKEAMEIRESLRWLTEVVVRSEQARMETIKEIERMRVEAQAKRGEMDLKRTEIIVNTQLEIARIFAKANKGVDSSLRIGRS